MSAEAARPILRDDLLAGRAIAVAGPVRAAVTGELARLGADLRPLAVTLDEPAVEHAAVALGAIETLVVDAAALFGHADAAAGELAPLRAAADGTWVAARSVANAAWIGPQAPGKLTILAPRPGDGPHADAARDALENLARTTSIEWARHGIRIVTVTPGAGTPDATVATIAAYLASPAGDYFSGCRLDLS